MSVFVFFFFFKQKTAYEMRISDWSSDVCSSDLLRHEAGFRQHLSRRWRRHGLSRVEEAKLLRPLKNLSRKGKFVSAAVLLAACGGSIALAQNVDGLDIQHILSRGEAADPDAEALIREVARRGDEMRADAREAADGGNRNLSENKAVLGGAPTGAIDFDEMLAASKELEASDKGAPQLIVFASLSMPEQSLKQLIRDTAKAGGTVVFNGFPGNSMKAFQQGIMKVVDNQDAYGSIGIDPRLFRAFDVTAVPAIVVVT